MRRYRYKRYRRRSTNVIKMKFQSFMDISTSDESMQIITISAGGPEILKRLAPQFGAYKFYKVGNLACKLVPASTLPVDPTGLSYGVDEGSTITVDPRDQLTPGMMRITNGEDVFEDISGLSSDVQHGIYNNMLLDPRWYKWMLQTGVKRHATPRYWQIGQLHQDKWPGATVNVPHMSADPSSSSSAVPDDTSAMKYYSYGSGNGYTTTSPHTYDNGSSSVYGFFQTGHKGVLGWLPTDGYQLGQAFMSAPPEVEVMKIILPKAYKTKYYYRMFITETVYFKDPIVNFGIVADDNYLYRPLDVFHTPSAPQPKTPNTRGVVVFPTDVQTGGNYGND